MVCFVLGLFGVFGAWVSYLRRLCLIWDCFALCGALVPCLGRLCPMCGACVSCVVGVFWVGRRCCGPLGGRLVSLGGVLGLLQGPWAFKYLVMCY